MAYGKLKADAIIYDNSGTDVEKTIAQIIADPEGTVIKSTGESGTTKFLRVDGDGTCSWQVPPDTTYSVQDGQLSQNSFTNADHSKLDGIEANATADQTASEIRALVESASDSNVFTDADHTKLNGVATSANNYTHPNHSGEVTSSADGAQTIASNVVDEDNLKISNSGSDGQFLQKQSGNTGGLTWATVNSTPEGTAILSTGESGGTKFLREDGDNSCSWQTIPVPTTITVADESSDTDCNVLFTTAATGDLAPKSGTNLTFNSNTGILTATGFAGDITGNVTGNVSGSAATVTGAAQTAITSVGTLTSLNTSGTFTEDINTLTTNSPVINCSLGNYFKITINSNCTFSFTNDPASKAYGCIVEVNHDGGTISWPSELKWSTDSAPSLTTGKTHLFFFTTNDSGSRWRGAYQVDYTD